MIKSLLRQPGRVDSKSLVIIGLAGAAVYAATLRTKPVAGGILAAIVAVRVGGMLWQHLRRSRLQPRTLVSSAPSGLSN
jgi:hypothetical protein